MGLVDELDYSVWHLTVFAVDGANHKVLDIALATLVVNLVNKVRLPLRIVTEVHFATLEDGA